MKSQIITIIIGLFSEQVLGWFNDWHTGAIRSDKYNSFVSTKAGCIVDNGFYIDSLVKNFLIQFQYISISVENLSSGEYYRKVHLW